MRKGYNQRLATEILFVKEQKELHTRFDPQGNVIRDYNNELKALSDSETRNILSETPIAVFDGCRKFSEHIQTEKSGPVVRQIKLAPLVSVHKRKGVLHICYEGINFIYGLIRRKQSDLPIFNQHREGAKAYVFSTMLEKYACTNTNIKR